MLRLAGLVKGIGEVGGCLPEPPECFEVCYLFLFVPRLSSSDTVWFARWL